MANVGKYDQVFRFILGIVIFSFVFIGPKSMWGFVGLIFIATAAFKFCPAYLIFHFTTCDSKKD